ncbi:hypothetical protein [Arthrobacter sp. HLT1-20]
MNSRITSAGRSNSCSRVDGWVVEIFESDGEPRDFQGLFLNVATS